MKVGKGRKKRGTGRPATDLEIELHVMIWHVEFPAHVAIATRWEVSKRQTGVVGLVVVVHQERGAKICDVLPGEVRLDIKTPTLRGSPVGRAADDRPRGGLSLPQSKCSISLHSMHVGANICFRWDYNPLRYHAEFPCFDDEPVWEYPENPQREN
jgi:hypothetical protein